MNNLPPANCISFNQLFKLFTGAPSTTRHMTPVAGTGTVQVFDLEPGLQARLWNCSFKEGVEMYCDEEGPYGKPYFTLAYFLDKEHLKFANNDASFQQNVIWDTLFISSTSSLRMYIPPATPVVSLNISFSKTWLKHHISECNETYQQLEEKLFSAPSFSLLEYMDTAEKKQLLEFVHAASNKGMGTFYVKSVVLKMICDFFNKLKTKTTLSQTSKNVHAMLTEAAAVLSNCITGAMPNLKALACQYGFSEVSLKRHFKQRFGVNMSTYFFTKKMAYAQQLLHEKNRNVIDVAHQLGYTNVNHFVTMFKKCTGALPVQVATTELGATRTQEAVA